jgi:hypothetical protein
MRPSGALLTVLVLGLSLTTSVLAWNPVVYQSDVFVNSERYNRFHDRAVVDTSGETIHASALDRHRNWASAGTRRWVDQWERDADGNPVRVWGWTWRDIRGRPHGDLQRKTYYSYVRRPVATPWPSSFTPAPAPVFAPAPVAVQPPNPIHEDLIRRNAGPERIDVRHTETVRYKNAPSETTPAEPAPSK